MTYQLSTPDGLHAVESIVGDGVTTFSHPVQQAQSLETVGEGE